MKQLTTRGMLLIIVAIAWIVGILCVSWLIVPAVLLLVGAGASLIGLIFTWHNQQGRIVCLCLLLMLLGAWRYTIASPAGDTHAISAFIGIKKLDVQGFIDAEPTFSGRSRILSISVSSVSTDNGASWQVANGEMQALLLDGTLASPYGPDYGDNVQLQGTLQPPMPHSSPEIWASMAFPIVSVTSSGGNPILVALFQLRVRFATIIQQALPQQEAALLIAILLGLKVPAIKPLIIFFNETGTAHLIAPSGFKVTLLAGLVTASTRWLYNKPGNRSTRLLPAQKAHLQ